MSIAEQRRIANAKADAKKGLDTDEHSARVVELVREKYSVSQEFAILRKKMAGLGDEEFNEYNEYVEQCKVKAREEFR